MPTLRAGVLTISTSSIFPRRKRQSSRDFPQAFPKRLTLLRQIMIILPLTEYSRRSLSQTLSRTREQSAQKCPRSRTPQSLISTIIFNLKRSIEVGVPAIKQVRQFYIKTRMLVELSSKNKLLIAFDFMI